MEEILKRKQLVPSIENWQEILLKCGGECRIRSSMLVEFGGKGERQGNRLDLHYISDATPEDIIQAGIKAVVVEICSQ